MSLFHVIILKWMWNLCILHCYYSDFSYNVYVHIYIFHNFGIQNDNFSYVHIWFLIIWFLIIDGKTNVFFGYAIITYCLFNILLAWNIDILNLLLIIIQLKYWFQLQISGDVFYLHRIWILHLLLIIILF